MEPKREILDENTGAGAEGKDKVHVREELKEPLFADDETNQGNQAANAGAENTHHDDAISGRKPIRFTRVLLLCSAALCLFLAAGFLLIEFKAHFVVFAKHLQRLEPVTSIMHPIPVPYYREMLDFLLAYEVEGQKMITAIRVEIGFQSPTRYQNFKERNVAFRDTVYAFLLRQNLPANSVRTWHTVLEKDLLDCLRVKLPESYPDKILLTQVENL